jgi:hypothetical protein
VFREYGKEREEVVLAVEYKSGGLILVDVGQVKDGKVVMDRVVEVSPKGVYQLSDLEFGKFPDPQLMLALPARPGMVTVKSGNGITYTRKVFGPEKVTVPAGTFRAIRVEHHYDSTGPGAGMGRPSFTQWFAPGVGFVKLTDLFGNHSELMSFTPGKRK